MVTVDNCLNSPHETATYAKIRDHIEPGVEDHHPLRQDGQRKRQHHASSRQHHQEGGPATTLVEEKNAMSGVRGAKGRLGEIRSMYVHHHLNLSCLHSVRDRFSQTLCSKFRNQPCSSMWPSKSGHGHVHKDFGIAEGQTVRFLLGMDPKYFNEEHAAPPALSPCLVIIVSVRGRFRMFDLLAVQKVLQRGTVWYNNLNLIHRLCLSTGPSVLATLP